MPSTIALMVVAPAVIPLTVWFWLLTAATAGFALWYVIVRPERGEPEASSGVADSSTSTPTGTVSGTLRATEAAGAPSTVIVALPVFVPLVAVMITLPGEIPVTIPSWLTVAFE